MMSTYIRIYIGGIGLVMGHELIHGYDDQGRQFDGNGILRQWMSQSSVEGYEERADCFVQQYDDFVAVQGEHVNGQLTLGENIADNSGLRLAFDAFKAHEKAKGVQPPISE